MNISTDQNNKPMLIAFSLAFLVWIGCFWGFLSGKLALTSDAVSYYDHTKFFVENLSKGIYPLWDPHWHFGAPNEFFLRRIGSFNPIYLLMAVLVKIKIPFFTAYMACLVGYFFLGCLGFYCAAGSIFRDRRVAFAAFLLILFSSLGTRIFDSFLILMYVPAVWFFASGLIFHEGNKRVGFLGMVFTAMLLFTTYIPFYFLNIVIIFALCFAAVYFKVFLIFIKSFGSFVLKNKLISLLCAFALILSLMPGLNLLRSSSQGEIALSKRHAASTSENAVEVGKKTITEWGIEEDLFYSYSFRDLKKFKFAVFYIPVLFYVLCGLGLFAPLNKRLAFLFLWAFMNLIVFSPYAPVYHFLHKHVFYFSYFRNLHFYLWWAVLPVVILFSCEIFRLNLKNIPEGKTQRILNSVVILVIHGVAAILASKFHYGAVSTAIVIAFSALFFVSLNFKISKMNLTDEKVIFFILLALIALQPIELYGNLSSHSVPKVNKYTYDSLPEGFEYTRSALKGYVSNERKAGSQSRGRLHYAVKSYNDLIVQADVDQLNRYLYHKFILSENVVVAGHPNKQFENMEFGMMFDNILTYVLKSDLTLEQQRLIEQYNRTSPDKTLLDEKSQEVRLIHADANTLKLRTNLTDDQFFIYNDNFHSSWRAYVDGEEVPLYRANYSFKGLWVPAGVHKIILRFGSLKDYLLNYVILIAFYVMFAFLVYFSFNGRKGAIDKDEG